MLAMNGIYIASIVLYYNFMTQIYDFGIKYENTHKAETVFQMAYTSSILLLANESYLQTSNQQPILETALNFSFSPYTVKSLSLYVIC